MKAKKWFRKDEMMTDEKIVLIDGHSILNRAFYGIPTLTNGEGLHTNAVYGFLNIMFKILDEEMPQYLAVAFDLHAPTFRHKMYAEYKGTRKPMPEELREQVPLMKEMLTRMKVPLMSLEGFEADDLIGTVSLSMEQLGLHVSILSGDRDLLQLASDKTMVRIPKTKMTGTEIENYHTQDVMDRYLVKPEGIIELKALMGDSSDNIPGIPGVGEKTAQKIIVQYGNIENAYEHLDEIKPARTQKLMRENRDLAFMSKTLATIDRHAPFELDLESARIGNLYTPEALEMCKRLEFKNMLPRFDASASQKAADKLPAVQIVSDIGETLRARISGKRIGLELISKDETLLGAALAFDDQVYYVPSSPSLSGELKELMKLSAEICTLDLKEQILFLDIREEEADPALFEHKFFDGAVAAYLLDPLRNDYTYDDIAKDYLSMMIPSFEELFGKKKIDLRTADEKTLSLYAGYQALTALFSRDTLEGELVETGMSDLFDNVEMPLVFTLYDMQKEGILVRADELKAYGKRLSSRISELEQKIYQEAGEKFNINSPKQLGTILFEKKHMPYAKKTKTGYSTSADILEKLAPEYPLVGDILEYRQLSKLKSTYADGLAAFIHEDGRIHCKFNQMVTATGRISSADPNLQNIPVRTELGRELRKVFIPKEGYAFVDADYSQIELRVLASLSGDENLINAYREAKDIHAITASQVFHIPLDQITPADRRNAKAVNFGIVYGISSFGLANDLSITRKEAEQYIQQYFRTYPGIKKFLDECVSSAKKKGYSATYFGRRRPIPELKSNNFMQRQFGERVAMNAPIQGTAADIIKIAMNNVRCRLKREGLKSRLIIQVHDELLIETAPDEKEAVKKILCEEMMGAVHLAVPLEVEVEEGKNWFEAH